MKLFATLAALLLFFSVSYANTTIDSLENRLPIVVGQERAQTLHQLTELYLDVDVQKSIELSEETYSSAVRSNMGLLKGEAQLLKAKGLYRLNRFIEAEEFTLKAKKVFTKNKEKVHEGLAITMLGHIYWKKGDYDKALGYYQDSYVLFKKANNKNYQVKALFNIGIVYRDKSLLEKALQSFIKANELAKKTDDKTIQANALNHLAGIYRKLGQYEFALANYKASLAIREEVGDLSAKAASLSNIGVLYMSMGNYTEALNYHLQSLNIKKQLQNDYSIAATFNDIGNVYWRIGELDKSLENHNKALALRQQINDVNNVAKSFENIGMVYKSMNNYTAALEYYMQALEWRKSKNIDVKLLSSYNTIASVYQQLARYDHALENYLLALDYAQANKDKLGMGKVLNNIGTVYSDLSNYDQALSYHQKAFEYFESLDDRIQKAVTLHYMGNVNWKRGNLEVALNQYLHALRIREEIGNKKAIAASMNNIGLIYRDMHDFAKSIEFYEQSLGIYESMQNQIAYANVLNNLGAVYHRFKKYSKAIEYYSRSLEIRLAYNRIRGIAITQENIGQLYLELKNYGKAKLYLEGAKTYAIKTNEGELIKNVTFDLYKLYQALGQSRNALKNYLLYTNQKDSILNRDNSKRIAEMQIKYEMNNQELEIKYLKDQNEINQEKVKYQKILLLSALIFLLIALFFIVQLVRYSRSKKKSNLMLQKVFSIMAHDLRSPVASLSGLSSMLNEPDYELSSQEKTTMIDHVDRLAKALMLLLDNLLNWSKTKQGLIDYFPETIQLNRVVDEAFELVNTQARNKNIELISEIGTQSVEADRNALSLILRNLLTNAIKFSFENGEVLIFVKEDDENVIVGVQDHGVGLSEGKINSIVSGENTSSETGTKNEVGHGIGMRLCVEFIAINQGKFWAESKMNEKTIFYFSLPKAQ